MILAMRLLAKESRTLLFSRVTRKKLLERVAYTDLHHTRLALNLGEIRPVCRRVKAAAGGIARYAKASSARVNEAEGLQVRGTVEVLETFTGKATWPIFGQLFSNFWCTRSILTGSC